MGCQSAMTTTNRIWSVIAALVSGGRVEFLSGRRKTFVSISDRSLRAKMTRFVGGCLTAPSSP